MPHLTIEYTVNLEITRPVDLLSCLNKYLLATGLFDAFDIKSRTVRLDDWCVGIDSLAGVDSTRNSSHAFVHARLSLLRGRSVEVRRGIAEGLLAELRKHWAAPSPCIVQWCVETCEIDGDTYVKIVG